ncbi:MAG: transposase [Elusimicrobia bacterium]|nr:transposase [Elusimicrobiota bacterium]
MPRVARIDLPDSFYHIVSRGIERRKIFLNAADYADFCGRLAQVVPKYQIQCMAWTLMPNHFHLFVRTGSLGLATFMSSLLTGYAVHFNLKYKRNGHLFQNRYKALLCERDPYFLELIRYVHLNPLRAGLVASLEELGHYPWAGHAVLMGNKDAPWQDVKNVLAEFGKLENCARQNYFQFVEAGWENGRDPISRLDGIMSGQKKLKDQTAPQMTATENIMGSEAFRERILAQAQIQDNVARQQQVSEAKAVLIFLGHAYLAKSLQELAHWTRMSLPAASKARWRGKVIEERVGGRVDLQDVVGVS